MSQIPEEIVSKLHHGHIAPPENYAEWFADLSAATAAGNYCHVVSALHHGWSLPLNRYSHHPSSPRQPNPHYTDRLQVYLSIADGWRSISNFRAVGCQAGEGEQSFVLTHPRMGVESVKVSELRQRLARTAFDLVLRNYFAKQEGLPDTEPHNAVDSSTEFLGSREFQVVRDFCMFELEGVTNHNLVSPRRTEYPLYRHLVDWLLTLPRLMWSWKEPEVPSYLRPPEKEERAELNARVARTLPSLKRWMMEVLYTLGELDMLGEWLFDLDEACLSHLLEIALRSRVGYTRATQRLIQGSRRAETLEEAVLAGSAAGLLLARRQLGDVARRRLEEVVAQRRAVDEAERRAEELAEAEKEAVEAAARLAAILASAQSANR